MRILCLDTATDLGSVAVVIDGDVRAELTTPIRARLGETLLGEIERALERAGIGADAIELCAVGTGPGSFTGLRVGLAVAKGLFLGLGTPLVGVPTPWTLARGVRATTSVVAIDARKDEAFITCFAHAVDGDAGECTVLLGDRHGPPRAMGLAARAALGAAACPVVVGTGATAELCAALGAPFERASPELDHPRASLMAGPAEARFRARGPDDAGGLVPRYVRGADAMPSRLS